MMRSLIMLGFIAPAAALAAYPDVSVNHPNIVAIGTLQSVGIMRGYPDGSFDPDTTLNRAELMKLLVESAGEDPDAEYYSNCFPDVRTEWFAPFVCFAAEKQWVGGYPDGSFQPGRPVNTAEALKMLVKSKGYKLIEPNTYSGTAPFGTGAWFAPYIATAIEADIVDANAMRTTWPDAPLHRSRAAAFLFASMLRDGHTHVTFPVTDCTGSGMTTVTIHYSDNNAVLDTIATGGLESGGVCALSPQFNPYRTATSGREDMLSPLLLPDPRLEESERDFIVPLSSSGRAYFVHAVGDPYLNAGDAAVWEFTAGSDVLRKVPITIPRPYVVSPDLQHVAFVRQISDTVSRLVYADLATGARAKIAELTAPESFFAYSGSGSVIGGFGFGTGNTLTYGVFDTTKKILLEDSIERFTKIRDASIDIVTLTLKP